MCWFGALPFVPTCSWWPLKSRVSFLSISRAVILTAECRHHRRNRLTPFQHVRMQPWEKPNCPLRQIEIDSPRKSCRRKRQTNSGEARERNGSKYLKSDAAGTVSEGKIYRNGKGCRQRETLGSDWDSDGKEKKWSDLRFNADRKTRWEKWNLTGRKKNVIGCRQRNQSKKLSIREDYCNHKCMVFQRCISL